MSQHGRIVASLRVGTLHWWPRYLWLSLLVCIAAVGCGDGRPERIPVKGRVTLRGGDCPANGTLYFAPISTQAGFPQRPTFADFSTDGAFEVSTFSPGDGLVPGTYRVSIEAQRPLGPKENAVGGGRFVLQFKPADLVIDAAAEAPVVVQFDVPDWK